MTGNVQLKPHLTHELQLDRLVERSMGVGDMADAVRLLKRFGYYRLSGYFYPIRKTKPRGEAGRLDDFVDGATLQLVVNLAEFDKTLRVLVMHAVETIEVAVRVAIAHTLGPYSPEAHLDPAVLDGRFTLKPRTGGDSPHDEWIDRFHELCERSREDFVKHHRQKYGGRMPIWVAIELWDFGLMSKFFAGLQRRDQAKIAGAYGGLDGPILASWLRNFSFVRNVVAHHGRLWNRTNTGQLQLPSKGRVPLLDHLHDMHQQRAKLYGSLVCMRYLLRTIQPTSEWHLRLKEHALTFPQTPLIALSAAGFPDGWEASQIWQ
ncbi:Abi family protein [Variovorax sp. J22P168]|uniref:Abi family protein n=1 Tax=Variovorax jilinensis TaxID=3053513 RepID=UPI0025765E85|nr:Abi family protein [Variovorax sp. J22P168]MDM0010881.1 Abi family protein [Variovorax sp. J22P168]